MIRLGQMTYFALFLDWGVDNLDQELENLEIDNDNKFESNDIA